MSLKHPFLISIKIKFMKAMKLYFSNKLQIR